jgi:1-acyl-sn-glycerol-3-phosphate acyltransferase
MPSDAADPGRREPDVNIVLHLLARLYFWLAGWQVIGHVPDLPKFIVAGGPHTSNMDGFHLILASWHLRVRLEWMVKIELTRGPLGWLVRALGGMPVDRSASSNTVDQIAEQIKQRERVVLVIAPEGTRKKLDHWKTGFYWIAHEAEVPLLLAVMDYSRKAIDVSAPLLYPSGDIESDMERIWGVYAGAGGRFPENVNDRRLRPSNGRNDDSEQPPGYETKSRR